jgi:hypothetical protein
VRFVELARLLLEGNTQTKEPFMFRNTTIGITIAAVAAIILWAPAPASATEPPAEDDCGILCGDPFGLEAMRDYYSPSLSVTGGFVADAPVVTTVTLPDGTLDAITDPGVDLPTVPDLPSAPVEPTAPAPVDPEPSPEPAPVDDTHETDSASSSEVAEESSATETTTTTALPTIQDDDVDGAAVAVMDLAPNQGPGEAFDPAMAALFGALGTLGLFGVGLAAFAIGRRGA